MLSFLWRWVCGGEESRGPPLVEGCGSGLSQSLRHNKTLVFVGVCWWCCCCAATAAVVIRLQPQYARFSPSCFSVHSFVYVLFNQELTNIRVHKRFRSMIEEYDPDLVVSVHPLCQEIPLRVMKNLKKSSGGSKEVPFVTVVTDLGGAHPTWWVYFFIFSRSL